MQRARSPGRSIDAKTLGNLGAALGALGRWQEAATYCRRALEIEPSATRAYNLGVDLAELGRPVEAERAFRQALQFDPRARHVRTRLAMTLCELGRLDEGIEIVVRTPGAEAENAVALADLSYILIRQGRVPDALRTAERAAELRPDLSVTRTALGWALLQSDRFSEALGSFDRALALDSDHADARAGRAAVFSILGEHPKALEEFSLLLETDPQYVERNDSIREYWRASKAGVEGGASRL